ncbi:hypothetical protein DNU06_00260 [Putridiphycobacter roseus]|uniref:Glycosyl transferase family 1 domain-containing protein n=1 Tax=Putridiphycobacter roseus TaxID=2219161 RepID=A0A2W1NGT1_9FLAO|nr:glycosyltransferase family 4 protein [Putridiphycobacter roseus]PZE18303.1 hypothetical protein DNU06_00260 [Putridiphycobacter roseus]
MENKIIGIKANYYPEIRNFTGLEIEGFSFVKKHDFYKFLSFPYFKLLHKTHPKWLNLFQDYNLGKYDMLHFFNAISLGSKPWVVTFEYFLPRGAHQIGKYPKENKYINKVLKSLAGNACKQIIALSAYAENAQIDYLKNVDPKLKDAILSKIVVLHPSQKLLVNKVVPSTDKEELHLVMVGADFFRKGGLEVLRAMDNLNALQDKLKLTIVSSMQFGDYASRSTTEDVAEAMQLIQKYSNITLHHALPNPEVINLFKQADIALLPSYDETYGYTVLEAQACACPVITTNGGAFTEINNEACGWVIEVPLKEGRSIPRGKVEKETFQKILVAGLEKVIKSALADKDALDKKSAVCMQRIAEQHDPKRAAETLRNIYTKALA